MSTYLMKTIPEQLSISVALPMHGMPPPEKDLVRFLVAVLSHVPEHAPHAPQAAHVPST